ncbi:MAG: glycoside hydrolase family 16 protein [Verrucomicrobiae bacterium]|nr:glycoside hydrolase family 16 protein [Verrucomicrobiae bacterium]
MRKHTRVWAWGRAVGLACWLGTLGLQAAQWELVWADEFNGTGLPDPAKWDYEEGWIRNNELQYYTRGRLENCRQENGVLVIEGRKEKFRNPHFRPDADPKSRKSGREYAEYTAASINTLGKASFLYGRVEVRAKLPQGRGVWPAIWMMGTNRVTVGWPRCGEIDIMEFVGKAPTNVHATVHWFGEGRHQSLGGKIVTNAPYDGFHIYAVEWFPDRMDFYFDHIKYFTYPTDKAGAGPDNPFRKPHYLLINLALGGSWGGTMDDAVLPQKYLIDYVRVYRQKP